MTDYIKREDAMKTLADEYDECDFKRYAEDLFKEIPSADVAPIRRGHWIYDCCDIVCSECGTAFSDEVCYMMRSDASYNEPKHCLWCGARMDGGINGK